MTRVLYRAMLRAYPSGYRARFAGEMLETFACDHARVRARGPWSLVPFWIVTIAQALWFGAVERRAQGGHPTRNAVTGASMPPSRFRFSLVPDVRYALRLLGRSPVFALTSIVSLALGLAATTVIFTVMDGFLLQASPGIHEPARVVDVGRTTNGSGFDNMTYRSFQYLRDHTTTLDHLSATTLDPSQLSLAEGTTSERIFGQIVSWSYFEALGVRPAAGRFFREDEDQVPEAKPVVVLTHRLWKERFGGDPAIAGRTLRLNNKEFVVAGVAEEGFQGTTMLGTDVWMPVAMVGSARGGRGSDLLQSPRAVWHTAVARLKPGVTPEQAEAELQTLMTAYKAAVPDATQSHGIVVARTGRMPAPMRLPFNVFFGVLLALTGGLLAIACSNVAGMLLARATARRREIATRLAVGASRGQLIAQLMTETAVLFLVAFVAAVPLAIWLSGLLQALIPALPLPVAIDWAVGARAILFAFALAMAAAAVFGLAPARHALRTDLSAALHGQASTATRERLRLRHGLVIAQVALSLTMVVTAGLFVRTLVAAATISPGFSIANVDVVQIDTTLASVEGPEAVGKVEGLVEGLRALPGVESVAHSRMVPLQGGGMGLGGVRVPGLAEDALRRLNDADWDVVSPAYFSTLQLPLREGRVFTRDDRNGSPLVAVVNETFAATAWPGKSAVGQRFWQTDRREDPGRPIEIVGVVGDAKYRSISESPMAFIYVPYAQHPQPGISFYLRHAEGVDLRPAVRQTLARLEPSLPILLHQTMAEATTIGLLPQQIAAWVAGVVGVIGLFLAALGLYGLTAFLVAQRTREIAIRMALGATHGQMLTMVLRQAGRLGLIGGAIGLVLAVGLGMVVQSMSLLVQVRATDPVTFLGMAALMAVVLLVASVHPARRAARTNPAMALRAE